MSTDFPGFTAIADADRPEARAVRDFFFVALFGALDAVFEAPARRALSLLPDFAFADLAALLFVTDREARRATAAGLRFRVGLDVGDALLFFATVRDDFVFAFFRVAIPNTPHKRTYSRRNRRRQRQISRLLTQFALESRTSKRQRGVQGAEKPH